MEDDALNVLGGPLEECSSDPVTGWFRNGCCQWAPSDLGYHTVCGVMTTEFLEHQQSIGNDLITPMPDYRFPGLNPGDRWCVTAPNWLQAHADGAACPIVLAATNARTLDIVALDLMRPYAVDVPDDPASLEA